MSENNNEANSETKENAQGSDKIEQIKQKAQELWQNEKVQEAWQNPKVQEVVQDKRVQAFWQNKTARYIVLAVVAVLFLYVGRGFYITSHYESKCKDVIAVLSDVNKLSDKFNAASGDPEDGDTKDAIEELKDAAEEIASLNESLKSLTPPEGKQGERTQITSYLDKYEIMFREAYKAMSVKGLLIKKANPDEYKIMDNSASEYIKTYRVINDIPPLFIKGENIKSVLDVEKFTKAWSGCLKRREDKDKDFYAEKKKEYEARLKESNAQLKLKKEVVFLPKYLEKTGKNIKIEGDFYNGTDKSISDIEEVTVDVVFKRLDDTVYTIENYKVPKDDMHGYVDRMLLRPQGQTGSLIFPELILKGEGEKVKEAYDNYIITVKDIKYAIYQE